MIGCDGEVGAATPGFGVHRAQGRRDQPGVPRAARVGAGGIGEGVVCRQRTDFAEPGTGELQLSPALGGVALRQVELGGFRGPFHAVERLTGQ